jgi:uncharacterized membrane protein
MDEALRVVVMVYPEHDTAMRAFDAVRALDHEGKVKVHDAAVVRALPDGQMEVVSTHRHAVKGAGKAAFWGLLIGGALALPVVGLVMAGGAYGLGTRKADRGKEAEFADRVRAILVPGKTALFVTGEIGTASPEEVIAVLAPFGGELAQSSILLASEDKMRHALREVAAQGTPPATEGGASTAEGTSDPAAEAPQG